MQTRSRDRIVDVVFPKAQNPFSKIPYKVYPVQDLRLKKTVTDNYLKRYFNLLKRPWDNKSFACLSDGNCYYFQWWANDYRSKYRVRDTLSRGVRKILFIRNAVSIITLPTIFILSRRNKYG
jgi:hypothetical protein